MAHTRSDETGIALVFTLFLMASLSALAVSLMFLAQTETSGTRNYRTMSQARYAGEAGVHKAINYMINTYTTPSTFADYNLTVSPVTCASNCTVGSPIVLASAGSGVTANYPDSTVAAAFAAAVQGTLATNVGGVLTNSAVGTVTYGASAKLLSMRQVVVYGGGTGVVQVWEITAVGTVPGALAATVEVTAMLEQDVAPAETFAVFATSDECGAITYTGNGGTDSYDSTNITLSGGLPVTTTSGGAVGTNGNLNLGGSVTVYGTLSTPRSGVGACATGSVTAMTGTQANVTGGLIQLPQAKSYPTPVIPASGAVPGDNWDFSASMIGDDCSDKMATKGWDCSLDSVTNTVTISPIVEGTALALGNVTIGANMKLVIGGTGVEKLNWNTLTVAGNTNLSMTNTLTELNLAGTGLGVSDPVLDFQGNFSNGTGFDPTKFQIMYAGTNEIKLRGNNELSATIYAPEAFVSMASSYDVYGSILAKKYSNSGGAKVHYDTSLSSKYFTLGNRVMSSFSWKKY